MGEKAEMRLQNQTPFVLKLRINNESVEVYPKEEITVETSKNIPIEISYAVNNEVATEATVEVKRNLRRRIYVEFKKKKKYRFITSVTSLKNDNYSISERIIDDANIFSAKYECHYLYITENADPNKRIPIDILFVDKRQKRTYIRAQFWKSMIYSLCTIMFGALFFSTIANNRIRTEPAFSIFIAFVFLCFLSMAASCIKNYLKFKRCKIRDD